VDAPERAVLDARLRDTRLAHLLTALTALAGMVALFARVPPFEAWLAEGGPPLGALERLGHLASVLIGLFLLYLSGQLRRRRRRAWQLALALLAAAAVTNLLRGPRWASLAATATPLFLLALARRSFAAPSDPPTLFRLLRFVPAWAGAVLCFGVGSLWLERDHLDPPWTLGGSLQTVASGLVGRPGAYTYEHRRFARFFRSALPLLGVAGAAGALWLAFRPLVQRPSHSPDDWARARRLVETWGTDTLAFFALRRDKSFFYSSDGEAFVAYGYFGGYALASGDPIGAPASIPRVIAEFVEMCRQRGWGLAFLAVREETLPLYLAHGLHSTYLGDEAILDCGRFDLTAPGMRKVRLPVHKLLRNGYSFEWMGEDAAGAETLARLREISARHHPGHEHGFTMALGAPLSGETPGLTLAIARNPRGEPEGFLRFVPCFGEHPGLSLDLMRRLPEAPNGITEFLIAEAAQHARERGIERLSLNFAAYGRLLEPGLPLGPVERILRFLVLKTDPLFQTRSLWTFNRKFHPDWLPRSLVYERAAAFPRVALFYVIAEGFVRIPIFGPLLVAQPADRS
jgi:lysyl-tRNA synthetase class 2